MNSLLTPTNKLSDEVIERAVKSTDELLNGYVDDGGCDASPNN